IKDYDRALSDLAAQKDAADLKRMDEKKRADVQHSIDDLIVKSSQLQNKDLAPFQGVWKATEVLVDGKAIQNRQQQQSFDWIIIDDRIVHVVDGQPHIGKIRISHPGGKTQIDVTLDGPAAGPATTTVFVEFAGDKMKRTFPAQTNPKHPGLSITLKRQDGERGAMPPLPQRPAGSEMPTIHTPFPLLPPTPAEKAELNLLAARA